MNIMRKLIVEFKCTKFTTLVILYRLVSSQSPILIHWHRSVMLGNKPFVNKGSNETEVFPKSEAYGAANMRYK